MASRKANKEKKYPPGTDVRILTPGYIGHLAPDEYKFLYRELSKRTGLRKRWFLGGEAQELSELHIRHVAMYGCPHTSKCSCTNTLKEMKNGGTTW